MATQEPVTVDKEELARAQHGWAFFGAAAKWGVVFIAVLLIGLGVLTL